jgi:hypothetical protein
VYLIHHSQELVFKGRKVAALHEVMRGTQDGLGMVSLVLQKRLWCYRVTVMVLVWCECGVSMVLVWCKSPLDMKSCAAPRTACVCVCVCVRVCVCVCVDVCVCPGRPGCGVTTV